jgi:hypothetical protein
MRKGPAKVYRRVLSRLAAGEDVSGEYQLLCANHNWIKRAENNETRRGRK